VNLTLLGGLGGLFLSIATFVVMTLALRTTRRTKEAIDAREAAELGIVMLAWATKMRRLGAVNGWDQDPAWPPLPMEATPEYLRGKAAATNNDELIKFIETMQKIAKGDPK
jgi:hypothetical protein